MLGLGNIQILHDLIGMIRRRFVLIVPGSGVGVALTLFCALSLPQSDEAIAVIEVDRPGVADGVLRDIAARRLERETRREALLAPGNLRTVSTRLAEQPASEIALIDEQARLLAARRAVVEASLARAPEVEATLAANARDLHLLQDRYAVTTRRLAEVETGRTLAESRKTEQMRILEAAEPPPRATASKRKRIAVLGAVASVLAGLGLAFLLELTNPVLRTSAQMQRAIGIRPVVSIPHVPTVAERTARPTRRIAGLSAAVLVIVAVVTIAGVYALSA